MACGCIRSVVEGAVRDPQAYRLQFADTDGTRRGHGAALTDRFPIAHDHIEARGLWVTGDHEVSLGGVRVSRRAEQGGMHIRQGRRQPNAAGRFFAMADSLIARWLTIRSEDLRGKNAQSARYVAACIGRTTIDGAGIGLRARIDGTSIGHRAGIGTRSGVYRRTRVLSGFAAYAVGAHEVGEAMKSVGARPADGAFLDLRVAAAGETGRESEGQDERNEPRQNPRSLGLGPCGALRGWGKASALVAHHGQNRAGEPTAQGTVIGLAARHRRQRGSGRHSERPIACRIVGGPGQAGGQCAERRICGRTAALVRTG